MLEQSTADRVKQIIAKQLALHLDQIGLEARFVEDLGADSFDFIELVTAVEGAFGIEIPDEDAETLTTVGDVIAYVEKANKKAQAIVQVAIVVVEKISHERVPERVIEVIAKLFKKDVASINRETRFEEDLGGDEFDFLTLASDLEKEFGLQKNDVDDEKLADCKTVGEAIDYFERVFATCK